MSTTPQTHLLAYPYPSSGHVIPLIDLTKNLISRNIHVTILLTPSTQHLVPTNYSPLLQTLILPASQFPHPNQNRLVATVSFMRQHHYPIILDFAQTHPLPPSAIISDFFLGWTHLLARDLHVPRLVFSPSGAFALSVSFTLWRDLPQNDDPNNPNSVVSFPDLPNSPVYPWWQLSELFRNRKSQTDWENVKNDFLFNHEAWGLVFNSFVDLEPAYLNHMKKELGHERVWAVGPVMPLESGLTEPEVRGGVSTVSCHELTSWLDRLEDGSVVYVCFGSRTVLTIKEMEVLTDALELSGVHFVLSVRAPDERHVAEDCGTIPSGFIERVRESGKGFVIEGWAPQLVILSHRAVGSFLTHCGWNSVLEGLVCGVVMLTWPMGADQYTNAKLLVDELGVAVGVGEGDVKVPEMREFAEIIKGSLGRTKERVRVEELRDAALGAIKENGCSQKELDGLVKELNELRND